MNVRFLIVKIGLIICLASIFTEFAGCSTENSAKKQMKTIGVTQIASHPGLDELRLGVISGLKEKGWIDGENIKIIFKNANRDPSLTIPIAQSFIKEKCDLIIPLTTPSTVAVVKSTTEIPIVFGGVTDPVGMGIVESLEKPGSNVTGTSDIWPMEASIVFFKKIYPNLKSLGVPYSPGDTVSEFGLKQLRTLTHRLGFKLLERPVSSASDIYSISRELFLNADAIYTGMDNMVVENLESVLKAGFEANKPVFAGDHGSASRGALAAMGIDQTLLGKETGYIAAKVLSGEDPNNIAVYTVKEGVPILNETTARRLKIDLPAEIASAVKTIK